MRRALRILGRVVLVLVLLIVVAVTTLYFLAQRRLNKSWQVTVPSITVPTDADAVARGKKIVTVYVPCGDCHGADFGSKVMIDDAAMGRLWASNLTRGRGGIAATYTDADWVRTLLHGVKPDGRTVVFMPSHEFHLTEADDRGPHRVLPRGPGRGSRAAGNTHRPDGRGPLLRGDAALPRRADRSRAHPVRARRGSRHTGRSRPRPGDEGRVPRVPHAGSHRWRRSASRRLEHHAHRDRYLAGGRLHPGAPRAQAAEWLGDRRSHAARLRPDVRSGAAGHLRVPEDGARRRGPRPSGSCSSGAATGACVHVCPQLPIPPGGRAVRPLSSRLPVRRC